MAAAAGSPDPASLDEESPAPPFDVPVCPRCLGDNSPLDNLCRHCGAPAFGVPGWYEMAIAQGWALGEATIRRDPPPVVLSGGLLLACFWFVVPGVATLIAPDGAFGLIVGAGFLGAGLYLSAMMGLHFLAREPDEEDAAGVA